MLARFVSYGAACSVTREMLVLGRGLKMKLGDFETKTGGLGTLDNRDR
jgi:hypothetical protein